MYGHNDLNGIRLQRHDVGRYGFSAARLKHLDATEFTLVHLAVDASGSTFGYQAQMEAIVKRIVAAFVNSERKHNLLLRLVAFDKSPREVHGFKPLSECDPADYDDVFSPGGLTALCDATLNAIEALTVFGHHLAANDYSANGLLVVLTDGMDKYSSATPSQVKNALAEAAKQENLESLTSILVGICDTADQEVAKGLMRFHKAVGFSKYIELRDVTATTMAGLADFITAAITKVNRALGTGKPPSEAAEAVSGGDDRAAIKSLHAEMTAIKSQLAEIKELLTAQRGEVVKEAYRVEEFAKKTGYKPYTIRQACNTGRIKEAYKGRDHASRIPHPTLLDIVTNGLPPTGGESP